MDFILKYIKPIMFLILIIVMFAILLNINNVMDWLLNFLKDITKNLLHEIFGLLE
ncbi:TPA: hypothetical protein ACG3JU_003747 [Clostridioides difficile]